MTKSKVIVRDLGFLAVMRELQASENVHITVGVHGDANRKDGGSMTLVAAANEFGTDTIPERSFIRSTIDARRSDIAKVITKGMGQVADGKRTTKDVAEIAGLFTASAIKKTMTELSEPPNAPSTIEKKGSDNPLIDTAALRTAITHKVDVGKARSVAAKFAVMSVPTLIFFNGGKVKDQVTGLVPKRAIVDRVEKVL